MGNQSVYAGGQCVVESGHGAAGICPQPLTLFSPSRVGGVHDHQPDS